jgi:hypothetical protein
MKPSNWLFNTARYAYASKSDYARVVIAPKTTREGPDAMALLTDDVAGAVLYVFCEPGTAVLRRAEEVGIAAVYCVLQAKDVARLIDAGHPLQLTVVDGVCDLKPQCFDFVRREVMSQWLEQPIVTRRETRCQRIGLASFRTTRRHARRTTPLPCVTGRLSARALTCERH